MPWMTPRTAATPPPNPTRPFQAERPFFPGLGILSPHADRAIIVEDSISRTRDALRSCGDNTSNYTGQAMTGNVRQANGDHLGSRLKILNISPRSKPVFGCLSHP